MTHHPDGLPLRLDGNACGYLLLFSRSLRGSRWRQGLLRRGCRECSRAGVCKKVIPAVVTITLTMSLCFPLVQGLSAGVARNSACMMPTL